MDNIIIILNDKIDKIIHHYNELLKNKPGVIFTCKKRNMISYIDVSIKMTYRNVGTRCSFPYIINEVGLYNLQSSLSYIDSIIIPYFNIVYRNNLLSRYEIFYNTYPINVSMYNQVKCVNIFKPLTLQEITRSVIYNNLVKVNNMVEKCLNFSHSPYLTQKFGEHIIIPDINHLVNKLPICEILKHFIMYWKNSNILPEDKYYFKESDN